MEATVFQIDFLPNRKFSGFTTGETRNGFAYPLFTFEQAQEVVSAWSMIGKEARYLENDDAFEFEPLDDEDIEVFSAETINGQKLYPIGAGTWIWSEADEDL